MKYSKSNWKLGLPRWLSDKESACQCSDKESACQCKRHRFDPWVRKMPWRRKWRSTPVFFPGKSHGQRSLVGYSSWVRKRVGHDRVTKQQQPTENSVQHVTTYQIGLDSVSHYQGERWGEMSRKARMGWKMWCRWTSRSLLHIHHFHRLSEKMSRN